MLLRKALICLGTIAVVEAGGSCDLPAQTLDCSLITQGDASVGAHNIQKCLSVGGTLTDGSPTEMAAVDGPARYLNIAPGALFNFNKGFTVGDSNYDWVAAGNLARTAQSSESGQYKVVVMTTGGTFNTYNFRPGGQAYDKGNTLVIFNTADPVVLTSTPDGRQFGPSVFAPFSQVTLPGKAGFVDGFVVAKSLVSNDATASQLQMHGNGYTGPITCGLTPTPAPTPPPPKPSNRRRRKSSDRRRRRRRPSTTMPPWKGAVIGISVALGLGGLAGGLVGGLKKKLPLCAPTNPTPAPNNPCAPVNGKWDASMESPAFQQGHAFGTTVVLPLLAVASLLCVVCALVGVARAHKTRKARQTHEVIAQDDDDSPLLEGGLDALE